MTHTYYKTCPECEGQGSVLYERVHSHNFGRDVGYIEEYEDTCENCSGTGQIEDEDYDEEEGDWLYHKLKDEEMDHD